MILRNLTVFVFFLIFVAFSRSPDGTECGICELLIAEVDKLGQQGTLDIEKILKFGCGILTPFPDLKTKCRNFVEKEGDKILQFFHDKLDPFTFCRSINLCNECFLFSNTYNITLDEKQSQLKGVILALFADLSLFRKQQKPIFDLDGDGFPLASREARYRGKDCNDVKKKIHPFLKSDLYENDPANENDKYVDNNCNGIDGYDHENEMSWEKEYCTDYIDDRNFLVFGDSVSVGFSIEYYWLDLKKIGEFLERVLMTGMEFPERSLTSGYETDHSMYLNFRDRNRCIHRQYLNLGVSGAMAIDLVSQVKSFWLKREEIKPSLVYLGFVGNDICTNSLEEMTKPEDYKRQLEDGLELLDTKLAKNSRVLLVGLSNGKQYDLMHDQIHPLSSKTHKITFSNFYDFLNCVSLNPCGTWLNTDKKSRDTATARALELDRTMQEIVRDQKYENFEAIYVDIDEIINLGVKKLTDDGYPAYYFFNQVDGFHPSIEYGHPYAAEAFAEIIEDRFPGFCGTQNPHNEEIEKKFGDQGGY